MLEIVQLPVLSDNYVYVLYDVEFGSAAVVDPAEAGPVFEILDRRGWRLDYILNTHHHGDHVGGNLELKQATGCQVLGAAADAARIPGIDRGLADGDEVVLGGNRAKVIEVAGHTRGHIAYWFAEQDALFCGDTLFSLGCGRLFEGSPQQMWASLEAIRRLPPSPRIYCAHEYTQANGRFARSVEPANPDLPQRLAEVDQLRAEGKPTVPSTLEQELATNPFLRPESAEIRKHLGMPDVENGQVFARLRAMKDGFR
ncbi:MAG: hydroxyacylglutathione hydrolase [Methylococcaceae bacterium]|nr:hydroxyacylglutathione hydrolase [Methylococcaceae bacterium]